MPFPENLRARRSRALALTLSVAALMLLLGGRLFFLQITRGSHYAELARENMVRSEPIPALRGRIFDREGRLLAGNRVSFNLSLEAGHPAYKRARYLGEAIEEVARLLGRDAEDLAQRARLYRNRFEPLLLDRDVDPTALGPFFERLEPIPGITIAEVPLRWYPQGHLAAHILGYMGEVSEQELLRTDHKYRRGELIGRSGLERQYESILRGRGGETYVRVDAFGRVTDLFPDLPPQPPEPGADLHLCIDAQLQSVAEEALARTQLQPDALARRRGLPIKGSLVAIDPWTGEILACASSPSFDPNGFAHGLSGEEWAALNAEDRPLLNRVIQAGYPPASLFKVVSTLAGIDAQVISRTTRFDACNGSYTFGNRTFGCWKETGHGRVDLFEAFGQSCDVYYYQLAREMGLRRLLRYMNSLGLDRPAGIDVPDEREGLIPDMEWYRRRLGTTPPEGIALNLSIGQGEIILTPLQVAVYIGALVSDGVQRRPHLARRAVLRDGTVTWSADRDAGSRVIDSTPETRRLVRELLEHAVESERATGHRARVPGFRIGGKTGTAQNSHGEDHALFLAVAPIDEPRIVVLAIVEEAGHGGVVAAPLVQQVLEVFLREDPLALDHQLHPRVSPDLGRGVSPDLGRGVSPNLGRGVSPDSKRGGADELGAHLDRPRDPYFGSPPACPPPADPVRSREPADEGGGGLLRAPGAL